MSTFDVVWTRRGAVVRMRVGDRVLMYDPAADLDPKRFRDLEVYDLKRRDSTTSVTTVTARPLLQGHPTLG
jgi:hypothetical protein